jgi:glycosyltransferase 2 family protein
MSTRPPLPANGAPLVSSTSTVGFDGSVAHGDPAAPGDAVASVVSSIGGACGSGGSGTAALGGGRTDPLGLPGELEAALAGDGKPQATAQRQGGLMRWASGVALGVLLYACFAAYTGFSNLRAILETFRWSTLALALLLASGNYLLRFFKWQYYLAQVGVRGVHWVDSLLVFLSGFVLTITPAKVGEVFKSAVLARTHGVPLPRTAPIVIAERLTDVMAIVLLVLGGSFGFEGGALWAVLGTLAAAIGFGVCLWPPPARWLLAALATSPRWQRFHDPVESALGSLRQVLAPTALAWPLLLSVVAWGLEGISLWVLLLGLDAPVSPAFATFFYSTATLAGALVPLPGGLGVTEGVIHQQLVRVAHVSVPTATAAMLLVRLATLWWAVVVGVAALFVLRRRFAALRSTGR